MRLLTEHLFLTLFLTGFTVGFGHCIGMCGPIVVSLSLGLKGRSIVTPHIFYHTGRVCTYAILGAFTGAAGSLTTVAAHVVKVQKGAMLLGGIVIIIMALGMRGWLPLGRAMFSDSYSPSAMLARGARRLSRLGTAVTYLPLGALFGLLPCGPVYTALIAAARAGMDAGAVAKGALTGTGLMLAFGVGTLPALFLVARLSSLSWLKSREIIYTVGAVLMLALGVSFVIKALRF